MASGAELDAMRRALALAAEPDLAPGPNPRVGCVLLSPDGDEVGAGAHQGSGNPHAEVVALAAAGSLARGATAVVSLEPCRHTGRTGPCTKALIEAGVTRVVYGATDPNPLAAGGSAELLAAGIDVEGGLLADSAEELNRHWTFAMRNGRPFVTWKVAATLDGRIAAADGSSRWITGEAARAQVHELRHAVDAVIVGTGTVIADDPALTARDAAGVPLARQPLRAVVGMRDVPAESRVNDAAAPTLILQTREPAEVLARLFEAGARHVLLESGPGLASAFVRAGLVDSVVWYVAPALLGDGMPVVQDVSVATIDAIRRLRVRAVAQVGADVRIDADFGQEV